MGALCSGKAGQSLKHICGQFFRLVLFVANTGSCVLERPRCPQPFGDLCFKYRLFRSVFYTLYVLFFIHFFVIFFHLALSKINNAFLFIFLWLCQFFLLFQLGWFVWLLRLHGCVVFRRSLKHICGQFFRLVFFEADTGSYVLEQLRCPQPFGDLCL